MDEESQRVKLLKCIGTLIDGHYGGQVCKRYLHELVLAGVNKNIKNIT